MKTTRTIKFDSADGLPAGIEASLRYEENEAVSVELWIPGRLVELYNMSGVTVTLSFAEFLSFFGGLSTLLGSVPERMTKSVVEERNEIYPQSSSRC